MPVGMQEARRPCHFPIPGLGSRTNDHLSACSEIWCICCHKRQPSPQLAPLSLLVAGEPFVGPWHVVWIMVMVLRLPHPRRRVGLIYYILAFWQIAKRSKRFRTNFRVLQLFVVCKGYYTWRKVEIKMPEILKNIDMFSFYRNRGGNIWWEVSFLNEILINWNMFLRLLFILSVLWANIKSQKQITHHINGQQRVLLFIMYAMSWDFNKSFASIYGYRSASCSTSLPTPSLSFFGSGAISFLGILLVCQ